MCAISRNSECSAVAENVVKRVWLMTRRSSRRIVRQLAALLIVSAFIVVLSNSNSINRLQKNQQKQQQQQQQNTDDPLVERRVSSILSDHPKFPLDTGRLPPPHLKTILLWNRLFWLPADVYFGTGQAPFVEAGCQFSDCFISDDRWLMPPSEYDSIIFFWPQMRLVPFTYSRKPSQVYVFFNDEPPSEYVKEDLSAFNNFFNLTISYRKDSDLVK